ncbi:MAG: flagellar motor protein MotB [Defluviitaleaceae bacterium]|nr:flagellar motor protein MotB [Defluviitaleaceae bacterium]
MGNRKKQARQRPGSPAWMTTWADLVSLLMCFFVLLFSLSSVDEARFQEFAEAMSASNRLAFMSGALGNIFTDSSGMMPENSPPIPPRQNPEAPIVDADDVIDVVSSRRGQMEELAETFRTYMAPTVHTGEMGESGQESANIAQLSQLENIGITVDALGEYMRITFPSGMLFASGQAVLQSEALDTIDYVAMRLLEHPGHRIAVQGHTDNVPISTLQFPSNFHLSAARSIAVVQRLISVHGFDPWYLSAEGMGEYRPIATNDTIEGQAQNRRVEILVFAQQQDITVVTD